MASFVIILLNIFIQIYVTFGEDIEPASLQPPPAVDKPEVNDEVVKDFHGAAKDWMDMFLGPNSNIHPTASASLIAEAFNANKCSEDQLKQIKERMNKISQNIETEIVNLLAFALNGKDDCKERKKRSAETPMDSSQLVMRLLKHMKSNSEHHNVAIDKMMSAQEIADKFGIEYTPEAEIIYDLADKVREEAKELTSIADDITGLKNVTKQETNQFVSFGSSSEECLDNNTVYVYAFVPDEDVVMPFEYAPEQIITLEPKEHQRTYEDTQIPSPPHHHHCKPPVSQKPNFHDAISKPSFSPAELPTTSTVVLPVDQPLEPELAGEEFEETVSSKVFVNKGDEPGSATVNHVMTYTVGEKSHFRTPQIEKLPQQMQYSFFLM